MHEFVDEDAEDPFAATANARQVAARQSEYHARRFDRESGIQHDAFAADDDAKTTQSETNSYADNMRRAELEREELRVKRAIEKKREEGFSADAETKGIEEPDATPKGRRWDVSEPERPAAIKDADMSDGNTARGGEWDDANTKGREGAVEVAPKKKRSRWDETPVATVGGAAGPGETPSGKRSRWDQTPVGGVMATPRAGSLMPFGMTPGGSNGEGSSSGQIIDPRNRYWSDEELNLMLPTEGYEIVDPPAGYAPIRTPARKLQETPMAMNGGGFVMQEDGASASVLGFGQELPTDIEGVGDLQFFKQEDATYFAKVGYHVVWM